MKNRMLQPVLPFLALPLMTVAAFGQMTGVSNPDSVNDTVPTTSQSEHYVKPARSSDRNATGTTAAVTATPQSYAASANGYANSYAATGPVPTTTASDPTMSPAPALIVRQPASATGSYLATPSPVVQTASVRREELESTDGDNGIVLTMPNVPHQINAGTVLRARLEQTIDTETTKVGTRFTAQLLTEVARSGEVLLPAGTILQGRVTKVHGGKRVSGAAAIRLQAESVAFPDGTTYALHATVSGIENFKDAHVNDEGTILAKTHPEIDAAALGLTTTAAAVTGAVVGGGVGAAVGAGIGAGVGTYMWLNRDHQEVLPAGIALLLSVDEPLQLNPH